MNENLDFIPTKGSFLKQNKNNDFVQVVHNSYKKKEKTAKQSEIKSDQIIKNIIDIHKTRHEIIKFGMSGFDGQRKEDAKVRMAIRLGARPHKNKYKNYKVLQEERKKEKESKEKDINFCQLGKNKIGKSIGKSRGFDRKQKKIKGALLEKYGKPTLSTPKK